MNIYYDKEKQKNILKQQFIEEVDQILKQIKNKTVACISLNFGMEKVVVISKQIENFVIHFPFSQTTSGFILSKRRP